MEGTLGKILVRTQVEHEAVGVQDIAKFAKRHPQIAYAGLGMLLQLELEYLQRKVHGIGSLTELLEAVLREAFFRALFWGEEVNYGPG